MYGTDRPCALVTGGAGFIGSHLGERLLVDGWRLRVVDNFATGRRENLAHLAHFPDQTLHEVDIASDDLDPLFDGVDVVFHLAALADIIPSITHPLSYFRTNVNGTLRVMEAARKTGVKRLVYAASSSCYGIPDRYPTSEDADIRPQYPYALTKYLGERTALHWGQVYGVPVVSLRLFNVYGPRARTTGAYGAVFGVFLAQKLAGEPFTVVGDGSQTRDFTHVGDVVDAFVAAARSEVAGEVMNVGSGGSYSVNRLVELIGGDSVHIPKRPGEPDCTLADVGKILHLLGWRARIGFDEGVAAMLDVIDQWREAPVWTPQTIDIATREWFDCLA